MQVQEISHPEVQDFLTSINLPEYADSLKSFSLSELELLTDKELQDLGIPIRLHRLKIQDSLKSLGLSQNTAFTEQDVSVHDSQSTISINDFSIKSPECMMLRALSGYLEGEIYIIGEKGAKIGRGSMMEIMIPDGFVSRKHCEIIYDMFSNEFLLTDIGSTTGTYIKTRGVHPLDTGSMFQIGSCEFKVLNISYSLEGIPVSLEMVKYEGPEVLPVIVFSGGFIGRSKSCEICIAQDTLMSNVHARISVKGNCFCIEDLNSCNKTWARLSAEGEFSEGYSLRAGDLIKIGTVVFLVEPFSHSDRRNTIDPCKNCGIRDCSIEILPCSHRACVDCAGKLVQCFACHRVVKEIMRIQ